jgi:hypothetical protein
VNSRSLVAALVLAVWLAPAHSADPPPVELRLIPGDAAIFVHADVAALHDSKVGEGVRNTKSLELKESLARLTTDTGLTLADVKSVTFVVPNSKDPQDFQRGMVVVTFKKDLDRAKMIGRMKEAATKAKDEFAETGNVVRVTSTMFEKRTQITDLSDPRRMVFLNDLPESYLKPAAGAPTGVHAEAIRTAATAPLVAGVNFNALPDEIRGENLPPEARPFQPILKADALTAVGALTKDTMGLTVRVRSKEKTNAGEVEKSFGALQTIVAAYFPLLKQRYKKDLTDPKPMVQLLGLVETAVKAAKLSVEDKETVATMTLPIEAPVVAFAETFFAGGGASARMVSSNNLKQLALAVYNYESTYGHYPVAASLGKKGKKLHSWRVAILPYIEHEALYKKFNLDEPWDSEHNLKVFNDNPMPKVFALPGSKAAEGKKTHYQVLVGNGAMFETVAALKPTDIQDGTSNTIMVATAATPVEWTKPDDVEFDPKVDVKKLLLFQGGVCTMAFGDGSVRAISEKVAEKTLKALATRSGGEVVGDDDN